VHSLLHAAAPCCSLVQAHIKHRVRLAGVDKGNVVLKGS
jgi:hypothetical protein